MEDREKLTLRDLMVWVVAGAILVVLLAIGTVVVAVFRPSLTAQTKAALSQLSPPSMGVAPSLERDSSLSPLKQHV